jgi:hypothetical protein
LCLFISNEPKLFAMAEVFRRLCGKPEHPLHKIRIAPFFIFLFFLINGASAQDKLFGLNMLGGPNNGALHLAY